LLAFEPSALGDASALLPAVELLLLLLQAATTAAHATNPWM
jgi:hypothetical protein